MSKYIDAATKRAVLASGGIIHSEAHVPILADALVQEGWMPPERPTVTEEPTDLSVRLMDTRGHVWVQSPASKRWTRGNGWVEWFSVTAHGPLYHWEPES